MLDFELCLDRPVGVAARSSSNENITTLLGWTPEVSLDHGLSKLYSFMRKELEAFPGI